MLGEQFVAFLARVQTTDRCQKSLFSSTEIYRDEVKNGQATADIAGGLHSYYGPLMVRSFAVVGLLALAVVAAQAQPPGASAAASSAEVPPGIVPLDVDLFTTDNFYLDRELWLDPRYQRCNSPRQLTDMWTQDRVGHWGDCDMDRPIAEIVSPYAYESAAGHYQALLEAAEARGGPTDHSRATLPDWDGWYRRGGRDDQWIYGRNLQSATLLSLLTPQYQQYMTQMQYHEAVSNAPQWNAAFCYPEGLMRFWSEFAIRDIEILTTPQQVQMLTGVADNFLRKFLIGRDHVQQVPQWYGETVAFWDRDTLVAWTANVQGWTISHSMMEFSNLLEVVEVIRPTADGDGLIVEATFYDPEAFVRPLHTVTPFNRVAAADDSEARYTYIECRTQSTIVNGPDGRPTQLTFFDDGYIDYFGRPWAQNWEESFEQGWEKPSIE